MKLLKKLVTPPHFEDEDKNRLAKVLKVILLFGFIAAALTATAASAAGQSEKTTIIMVSAAFLLLLQVPLWMGRIRLAIFLTFILALFLVTSLLCIGGGIHDLGSMLFPVIIAGGGLLLRPKEFLVITLLSWLSASAIVLMEVAGWIRWPAEYSTSIYVLLTITGIFLLAAAPVRLLANDLNRHIARVRNNETELRQSNEKLQHEATERRHAESALRESEKRFRILAESTYEGLCILEKDAIIDVNPSLAKMLGCEIQDIIGKPMSAFLESDRMEAVLQQLHDESGTPFQHQLKRPDGTLVPVESRSKSIPYQGRTVRVTACIDISERRRSEEEHRILEAEIRQSQKLESLGTLAGGIAHDFNNIISIISGHADILAGKLKKFPEAQATLRTISDAAERGSAMVRQILTFARKSEADFRALSIQEMINELVKMLRVTFPRTMEINYSCPPDLPKVWMDSSQLHQALLNLCINARDAMAGIGRLDIITRLIDGEEITSRFPAAAGRRMVCLQVSDTGAGMDEKTRERIFEPFFSTKGRGKGTGLGLAVVYGVVQAHNGYIEVESQPGRGTSFSLYFPASERQELLPTQEVIEPLPAARGHETILLVEDEEDLRELLSSVLHDYGYGIIVARDGMEALERYRRHRDDIQLVITDMDLPKINGAAVSQSILSDNPDARIILISGFVETALKNSILAGGVREFVAKPYTLPQMLRIVRKVLDAD